MGFLSMVASKALETVASRLVNRRDWLKSETHNSWVTCQPACNTEVVVEWLKWLSVWQRSSFNVSASPCLPRKLHWISVGTSSSRLWVSWLLSRISISHRAQDVPVNTDTMAPCGAKVGQLVGPTLTWVTGNLFVYWSFRARRLDVGGPCTCMNSSELNSFEWRHMCSIEIIFFQLLTQVPLL